MSRWARKIRGPVHTSAQYRWNVQYKDIFRDSSCVMRQSLVVLLTQLLTLHTLVSELCPHQFPIPMIEWAVHHQLLSLPQFESYKPVICLGIRWPSAQPSISVEYASAQPSISVECDPLDGHPSQSYVTLGHPAQSSLLSSHLSNSTSMQYWPWWTSWRCDCKTKDDVCNKETPLSLLTPICLQCFWECKAIDTLCEVSANYSWNWLAKSLELLIYPYLYFQQKYPLKKQAFIKQKNNKNNTKQHVSFRRFLFLCHKCNNIYFYSFLKKTLL